MTQYIDKAAIVAEIKGLIRANELYLSEPETDEIRFQKTGAYSVCNDLLHFLDTLEVKEVDEQKERMSECPYRQVGCTMYKDKILECNGTCSWVVDYPKLKELKTKKEKKILMI